MPAHQVNSYGRGWPSSSLVTLYLNGRVSRVRLRVDFAGTFNYAINQVHEFYSGPLPVGSYTMTATDTAGHVAQAMFTVHG